MRCSVRFLLPLILALAAGAAALAQAPTYRLGRTPSDDEIRKWDIAVGPAGRELPAGNGTALEGAKVFSQKCAACHGQDAEGTRLAPRLVGGVGTITSPRPVKTPGSFYPFATTIWDYINRAMPKNQEGTLSANEVYAVTAYVLYRNGIIRESDAMDATSLPKVRMPNRNGFIPPEPAWKPGMKRAPGFYPETQR